MKNLYNFANTHGFDNSLDTFTVTHLHGKSKKNIRVEANGNYISVKNPEDFTDSVSFFLQDLSDFSYNGNNELSRNIIDYANTHGFPSWIIAEKIPALMKKGKDLMQHYVSFHAIDDHVDAFHFMAPTSNGKDKKLGVYVVNNRRITLIEPPSIHPVVSYAIKKNGDGVHVIANGEKPLVEKFCAENSLDAKVLTQRIGELMEMGNDFMRTNYEIEEWL